MSADSPASSDTRADAALAVLHGLLTEGETLEAYALQHRLYALLHRRTLVAATSGRLIVLRRGLLGGFDSDDIRWQDLKETHIRAGLIAADLTLIAQGSTDLNITAGATRVLNFEGMQKDQAQAVYRICQSHDQVWREKRRIRELEELRARAGGVQIAAGPYALGGAGAGAAGGPAPAGDESEATRRLRQAKEMLDARLISDAEYESIKAKIIAGL